MGKSGPAPRPALALVREGNPGHRASDRLKGGLTLESVAPEEPDWRQWWPTVRVPTIRQLENRYPLEQVEGQLVHIDDDGKRERLAIARREWLISRDREVAERSKKVNTRAREVCRSEWRRVVPILERQGLLTQLDAAVLVEYCRTWARLDECERNISELGIWQRGERGAMKNPATTVANQLRQQLKFYVGELGLTPIARDAMQPREADDDADEGFD